ncbi:MAG TPA: phosphatidate cytidylyltransferase [Allosphingosinicella sp.]|nr:phosphatidate cytidylyltransferase [Allosphingosinicella sp.]
MTDTPQKQPGQPDSDITIRFAMGVAMIAVALLVTIAGGWAFRVFALVAAGLMLVEWADIHKVQRLWAYAGAVLAAAILLGAAEYYYPNAADEGELSWISFAPALGAAVLLGLASRSLSMGWGFAYIVVPAFALVIISWVSEVATGMIFWVLIVTWATDIFAYLAGRAIGGPKLAPKVSPNKTWAGLIGGIAGASFFGWLVAWYFDLGRPFLWVGATMGLIAQLGDLYESWVKRRAGVKDSSSLLPGHGGVLDRLDGLLAVAAATMLILLLELWTLPEPIEIPDTVTVMHVTGPQAG